MEDQPVTRAEFESLRFNLDQLTNESVRPIVDRFDTLNTPRWKRLMFRLDGWPPWYVLVERPRWRPWRRFWTS